MEQISIDCDYYMENNKDLKALCTRMSIAERQKFLTSHYERFGHKEGRKVRFITTSTGKLSVKKERSSSRKHTNIETNLESISDETTQIELKLIDKLKRNFRKSIKNT